MERKITIEESVPYTEDYQNKMLEENQVEGEQWKSKLFTEPVGIH